MRHSPSSERCLDDTSRARLLALLMIGILVIPSSALAWLPSWVAGPSVVPPKWGYQGPIGPDHWADLDPSYAPCQQGLQQSPIDIRSAQAVARSPLSFFYRSSPLSLTNDGQTIWGDGLAGSYLIANNRRYELARYQFHIPSEHLINGQQGDMELQLLHRDGVGRQAMVAVLFKAGRRSNSILRRMTERLPPPGKTYHGSQIGINPLFLLPPDKDYFVYSGSLTHPPCSEGIEWLVLRSPLEVDAKLIRRFQQAMGHNARPVQPRGDRLVHWNRRP